MELMEIVKSYFCVKLKMWYCSVVSILKSQRQRTSLKCSFSCNSVQSVPTLRYSYSWCWYLASTAVVSVRGVMVQPGYWLPCHSEAVCSLRSVEAAGAQRWAQSAADCEVLTILQL